MCCFWAGIAARKVSTLAEDRVFAEVIFDDLGHERIDPLVVRHARPQGVGQADLARPVRGDQPGHAELAVAPEGERVEVIVVDPPVDHVDPRRPPGGPHEDLAAVEEQVAPLDQLDAHLPGQEAVLVVGRVVDARGQDHHRRVVRARRGDVAEHRQQVRGIIVDGPDVVLLEEAGNACFITWRFLRT